MRLLPLGVVLMLTACAQVHADPAAAGDEPLHAAASAVRPARTSLRTAASSSPRAPACAAMSSRRTTWAQSVLKFAYGQDGLALAGTYTPFHRCATAANGMDLGSRGIALPPASTAPSAARLLAVGGKQRNVHLQGTSSSP
jgi:hypothetical protein